MRGACGRSDGRTVVNRHQQLTPEEVVKAVVVPREGGQPLYQAVHHSVEASHYLSPHSVEESVLWRGSALARHYN